MEFSTPASRVDMNKHKLPMANWLGNSCRKELEFVQFCKTQRAELL